MFVVIELLIIFKLFVHLFIKETHHIVHVHIHTWNLITFINLYTLDFGFCFHPRFKRDFDTETLMSLYIQLKMVNEDRSVRIHLPTHRNPGPFLIFWKKKAHNSTAPWWPHGGTPLCKSVVLISLQVF